MTAEHELLLDAGTGGAAQVQEALRLFIDAGANGEGTKP